MRWRVGGGRRMSLDGGGREKKSEDRTRVRRGAPTSFIPSPPPCHLHPSDPLPPTTHSTRPHSSMQPAFLDPFLVQKLKMSLFVSVVCV